MTEDGHRKQLTEDIRQPDETRHRREGAAMRLAYYYPEALELVVMEQLRVPVHHTDVVKDFLEKKLYPQKSAEKRAALFEKLVAEHGPAVKDGVVLKLFDDLDTQIAAEEKRIHPAPKKWPDARSALIRLYGYDKSVMPADKPYVASWSDSDREDFIDALGEIRNPAILKEVKRIRAGDQ
jgi:hypothetical protein